MYYNILGFFIISTILSCDFFRCPQSVGALKGDTGSGGLCESDPTCVCVWNADGFVMHCEGELHLTFTYGSEKGTMITIACNASAPSVNFSRNYYSLLKLDSFDLLTVGFSECPEPEGSYARLFFPSPTNFLTQTGTEPDQYIYHLQINCGSRKNFSVAKKNFLGLTKLEYLSIRCPVLSKLPSDLFQWTVPKLRYLEIIDTRIEYIPDYIFSSLSYLSDLTVIRNRVQKLHKENLIGLQSLRAFDFSENNITFLGMDLFERTKNVEFVNISRNKLNTLPISLNNIFSLKVLDLGYNSFEQIEQDDCSMFSNLLELHLTNNRIKKVDPTCFSLMKQITYVDLSGNAIFKLPDYPVVMENLYIFNFNDNSGVNLYIGKFLVSSTLHQLKMRNSSIISVKPDVLHGLPLLKIVDFSKNSISILSEDFFFHNPQLRFIYMQENKLSKLPAKIFHNNPLIEYLNLSSNNISHVDSLMLKNATNLKILDLSNNVLKEISGNLLSNLSQLRILLLSGNEIVSLKKEFFRDTVFMEQLDLSHNMFTSLPQDIFSPLTQYGRLLGLSLQGNRMSSLPILEFPQLEYLNLAGNRLEYLPVGAFHKMPMLELLNLSRNVLRELTNSPIVTRNQKLVLLDMSHNRLEQIPLNTLSEAEILVSLDFSGNKIDSFFMEWIIGATSLHRINLTDNNMSFIGVDDEINYYVLLNGRECPLKVIDLSNNNLSFNYTEWMFEEDSRTWGRISPLSYCGDAEIILLTNNSIDSIFMDWRVMLPHLKWLDLRKNKIKHLTQQDMLFSTATIYDNGYAEPYPCNHSLTVDLRENLIRGVELPSAALMELLPRNVTTGKYGHATILLDGNPFSCGCGLLKFLRLMDNDIVLTSELQRREELNWVMPAKIEVGNLSCWNPKSVRGKKILEPETWVHHLLPMFGLCSLNGYR